jgi:mRNA turnover protein 4
VGLLFTNTEPQEVIDWFADFQQPDYARAGNIASRTVTLPVGPVLRHHSNPPEPFPHNEEPQLRKLGLTTSLTKGIPTLTAPHLLCQKGKSLTSEQAQLLKLTGLKMVTFRVRLLSRWDAASGEIVQIEEKLAVAEIPEDSLDEDAEMSE